MSQASIVPEGADIPYHLVSVKWYKLWEDYCKGDSETEPGKINSDVQLRAILALVNTY